MIVIARVGFLVVRDGKGHVSVTLNVGRCLTVVRATTRGVFLAREASGGVIAAAVANESRFRHNEASRRAGRQMRQADKQRRRAGGQIRTGERSGRVAEDVVEAATAAWRSQRVAMVLYLLLSAISQVPKQLLVCKSKVIRI